MYTVFQVITALVIRFRQLAWLACSSACARRILPSLAKKRNP